MSRRECRRDEAGVLPHDLQAERSVLGAILIEPDVYDAAVGVGLRSGMFHLPAHARLWEAIGSLRDSGQVVDAIMLRSACEAAKTLDEVGGMFYISGLLDGVPRATNVEGYAAIVRDKARLRDLIAAARLTIDEAFDGGEVGDLLSVAESRLMAVSKDHARGDFVLSSDWMRETWTTIERAANLKRVVTGVPTGVPGLDRALRGFQPSDLILIAARPSNGKTALALQAAIEASQHTFVSFSSMEMSRESVGIRAVAHEANVDAFRILTGQVQDHEMRRVGEAMSRIAGRQIAIDDASGQDISALCSKIRRLKAKHDVGIAFVDYLQLMHAAGTENRTLEIGRISGRLKGLAKELRIPVVALSQLTRDNDREKRRPRLSDLRDSGSLEQDADVVIFIHRPNKPDDTARFQAGELVELVIAKHRNGAISVEEVEWNASTMRFAERFSGERRSA